MRLISRLAVRTISGLWAGPIFTSLAIALLTPIALAAFQQIDPAIFGGLPAPLLAILGVPVGALPHVLAFNVIIGTYGGLAIGLAVVIAGAKAAAADETSGRLALLFSTRVGRTHYFVAQSLALGALIFISGGILLINCFISAATLNVDLSDIYLLALWWHLVAVIAFHAFLGFAVSAAVGTVISGVATGAGLLFGGIFISGLLPHISGGEEIEKFIPWQWLNKSQPLTKGVDGVQLAVAFIGALVLLGLAFLPFLSRDLNSTRIGFRGWFAK